MPRSGDIVAERPHRRDASAERGHEPRLAHDHRQSTGETRCVAWLEQESAPAILDELRDAAGPRRDDRHAREKRLVDDQRAVIRPDRWHHEHVDPPTLARTTALRNR